MSRREWSLQDAKNRFSSVVRAARRGEAQTVTKHGKPAVVVVAAEDYRRLSKLERLRAPRFVEHLLAMPEGGEDFARIDARLRDAKF